MVREEGMEFVPDIDQVEFDEKGKIQAIHDTESGEIITGDTGEAHNEQQVPFGFRSVSHAILADYGIQDGRIQYGDDVVHIDDLSIEEQYDVIAQIKGVDPKAEDKPGGGEDASLNMYEKHVLNLLRSGLSIEEMADQLAGKRVNVSSMDVDSLNILDIRSQYPNFTDEDVMEELEDRKAGRNYDKKAELLRQKYADLEKVGVGALSEEYSAIAEQQTEEDRRLIVNTVSKIDNIHGIPVDNEIKNFILGELIELEDNGNSPFVNSLENPAEMFKLAYYKHAFPQMIDYYEGRLKAEYERGRSDIVKGFPGEPVLNQASRKPVQQDPVSRSAAYANRYSDNDDIIDFG